MRLRFIIMSQRIKLRVVSGYGLGPRGQRSSRHNHLLARWWPQYFGTQKARASVKRTYDIYYAQRLPPDVQIELQRHTVDFRNFFCLSEIDTRDVQKLSKNTPTFNEFYRKFDTCVDWALRTSHFLLAGVLLTAVSIIAAPFWWLCDHCVYLSSVLSWFIDVCIIKLPPATPENIQWNYMKSLLFFNIHVLKS